MALAEGDDPRADELFAESLSWCRKRGDKRLASECLGGLAGVAAVRGENTRAARLWGAAEGLRATIGAAVSPIEQRVVDRHLAGVRDALGETALEAEWSEGRGLDLQRAIAYASAPQRGAASA